MATYNKFNDFVNELAKGKHVFGTDAFKLMLTNSAPVATNTIKSDITDISAGNGYTAGGASVTVTESVSTGTVTTQGTQVVITAAGGTIGPFRYAVLYNDTQSSPVKPLVAWWDYGSSITLNDGESLTATFNSSNPGNIFTLT